MSATEKYELAKKIAASPWFIKRNILAPKSFTLSYAFYRVMRPLLKLNYKMFKLTRSVTPWTSQASINIFERLLEKDMIGFEYGSGMSTIFIATRIAHLTSVEHNEVWFGIVRKKLKEHNLENVDYHCVPMTDKPEKKEHAFLQHYAISPQFHVRDEYSAYFTLITTFPPDHFDFIFVDGRARVECTLNAIPRLKEGGMLVLDNSDRKRYAPVFEVLKDWPSVTSTTGLFDTTIWFKPETR